MKITYGDFQTRVSIKHSLVKMKYKVLINHPGWCLYVRPPCVSVCIAIDSSFLRKYFYQNNQGILAT